jgi:hypothetical protein
VLVDRLDETSRRLAAVEDRGRQIEARLDDLERADDVTVYAERTEDGRHQVHPAVGNPHRRRHAAARGDQSDDGRRVRRGDEAPRAVPGARRLPRRLAHLAGGRVPRYHAALKAECQAIDVEWRVGTVEMAKLFAASANAAHGLRRTAGDKRRAIEMVLSTADGRRWSQKRIAKHCGVAQSYISGVAARRADYHSDNPPKNPPPAKPTKAEQKRARIADAAAANPRVSNRSIARQLGVDRDAVAAVRASATETCAAAPANDPGDPPSATEPAAIRYSTPAAHAAASRRVLLRRWDGCRQTLSSRESLWATRPSLPHARGAVGNRPPP